MGRLLSEFGAVAALVVLILLALIAIALGGAFNWLTENQAAFLGTLAGAFIGFMGLLAGALYNAHLNRELMLEDEEKRQRSCLLMLHARIRTFATTSGLLARTVEQSKQVTVDNIEAFELSADSLRPEQFPDLRLIDAEVLADLHDLNAHAEGTRFSVVAPIKLCAAIDGVHEVNAEFVEQFAGGVAALCDDAIALRKKISRLRDVGDLGPGSFSEIAISRMYKVTK